MIGKKIVCMRKNAEINCLPQRCIWKKYLHCGMQDLVNIKKLSAQPEWRKKTCKRSIDGGKNFLSPRNHDYPPSPGGEIMVRPLSGIFDGLLTF